MKNTSTSYLDFSSSFNLTETRDKTRNQENKELFYPEILLMTIVYYIFICILAVGFGYLTYYCYVRRKKVVFSVATNNTNRSRVAVNNRNIFFVYQYFLIFEIKLVLF